MPLSRLIFCQLAKKRWLFKGGLKNYKTLVTDVGLKGLLNGWQIAAQIR